MLIAIVGTRLSGKSAVERYFISNHGFTPVYIMAHGNESPQNTSEHTIQRGISNRELASQSNLNGFVGSQTSSTTSPRSECGGHVFSSADKLLQYVTKRWRDNFVTLDLHSRLLVQQFIRRPFFMLINVDAPLHLRYLRAKSPNLSLLDFVLEHDHLTFGDRCNLSQEQTSLQDLSDLIDVQIINDFLDIPNLYAHLDELNLLDPEILRPGWDAYFMTLASLASQRSNCMKRRVGAVLVRDNRVVSTGYNGTPRGLQNCNAGGCPPCNGTSNDPLLECVCLHAEENALLEAGRERVGSNAVLYCNTCPCLRCTIKIIQLGVKTVVYNLVYKVDDASALLFQEAGVKLRRSKISLDHLKKHVLR